jgi:hypothetical protein
MPDQAGESLSCDLVQAPIDLEIRSLNSSGYAFSKLVSISNRLVRRVSEAARGAATDTHRIQEKTMRFMVIGMATKESEAGGK